MFKLLPVNSAVKPIIHSISETRKLRGGQFVIGWLAVAPANRPPRYICIEKEPWIIGLIVLSKTCLAMRDVNSLIICVINIADVSRRQNDLTGIIKTKYKYTHNVVFYPRKHFSFS